MKIRLTRKTILITGLAALAVILILTFLIAPKLRLTNSPTAEALAIPDYGSAMVTIGDIVQHVTGKIVVDSFGQITIQDDLSGEVYVILASQIIDQDQLVAFATTNSDGQATEVVGEVVAQSENGTSTVLDPTTGTQYIVETTLLKKVSIEKTISTSIPTEITIAPTTETLATSTAATETTPEPIQTSTPKKNTQASTTPPTTVPTTQVTTIAPVVADEITHESYTVSTDPTLETAFIGPTETSASDLPESEAIRMDSSYINDVFSEINRTRQVNGTDPLSLDSADSGYSQAVWAYADELAWGIANNAPDFPHVWIMTQANGGAGAAKDLIDVSTAVLDPSVHAIAISAVKDSVSRNIYLVIAF
jgi:hypothetical protein